MAGTFSRVFFVGVPFPEPGQEGKSRVRGNRIGAGALVGRQK
jgi:hypothetical protein